jgi:hypothetical protein
MFPSESPTLSPTLPTLSPTRSPTDQCDMEKYLFGETGCTRDTDSGLFNSTCLLSFQRILDHCDTQCLTI